jgi:hypothetical protein
MTSSLFNLLTSAYTSKQIIDFLIRKFPQHAGKIHAATAMGFTPQQILNSIAGGNKNMIQEPVETLTEHEKILKSEEERKKKQQKALLGAATLAGGTALGTYALSRALPAAVQQLAPNLLGQGVTPVPTPAATPTAVQAPIPTPTPAQAPVPSPINTVNFNQFAARYPNIYSKVKNMQAAGNDISVIKGYYEKYKPGDVKRIEKESGLPFQEIVEGFFTNPSPEEKPEIEKVEPEKIIEKKIAMLPSGDIGEIESEKNGIAKINVNGQEKHRKLDEIKQEPPDLETAVNYMIDSIPEKEKSTAMQESIYVPELKLMLTKFWDGKIAWYLDVDEDLYDNIALGLYQPKTKGKTGIAEYNPGVIDSRGAGFSEQISRNPKYSKEAKGKLWGYANNKYDALNHIRQILLKKSKERYDEEGNLIVPRKRKT